MPGNAQAKGLSTLISSGERSTRPTEGVCGSNEPLISQVAKDRGAADADASAALFLFAKHER